MSLTNAGIAILIEGALIALAAFGGPHGSLGAIPWTLQLPGILLVFYPPGGTHFLARVVLMGLVQAVIWYLIVNRIRRRRSRQPQLPM